MWRVYEDISAQLDLFIYLICEWQCLQLVAQQRSDEWKITKVPVVYKFNFLKLINFWICLEKCVIEMFLIDLKSLVIPVM
jgi:hypothetical protein